MEHFNKNVLGVFFEKLGILEENDRDEFFKKIDEKHKVNLTQDLDLAVALRKDKGNGKIYTVKNKDLENCKVSIVEVIDEQGSKIMNKGIGKYVTLESNLMKFDDDESREEMITYLKDELVEILGSDKTKKTLVIGLGNWNITSDALGPKSVS